MVNNRVAIEEDDLLPLSLISQYGYCPRRAGLMMVDQQWADNIYTVEGELAHARVHAAGRALRKDQVELLSMPVRSMQLGVSGVLDSLELTADKAGVCLRGLSGTWRLFPIEYKRGKVRMEREYEMQLCAQAICLEEMLSCSIEHGAVFYTGAHRRHRVAFSSALRKQVSQTAAALHAMRDTGIVPSATKSKKCSACSLKDICLLTTSDVVEGYLLEVKQTAEGRGKL